ncbi:hypothetical protein L7F22_008324 [Adiantum nelumboides]|nr:hypothetical protein [Adiantum nelumboides]
MPLLRGQKLIAYEVKDLKRRDRLLEEGRCGNVPLWLQEHDIVKVWMDNGGVKQLNHAAIREINCETKMAKLAILRPVMQQTNTWKVQPINQDLDDEGVGDLHEKVIDLHQDDPLDKTEYQKFIRDESFGVALKVKDSYVIPHDDDHNYVKNKEMKDDTSSELCDVNIDLSSRKRKATSKLLELLKKKEKFLRVSKNKNKKELPRESRESTIQSSSLETKAQHAMADYLSRLDFGEPPTGIADEFLDASLFFTGVVVEEAQVEQSARRIPTIPWTWYEEMLHHLDSEDMPAFLSCHQRRRMAICSKNFEIVMENLYYRTVVDVLLRHVLPQEQEFVLEEVHTGIAGGHFALLITARKILQAGLWWPTLFQEAKDYVQKCDAYQWLGQLLKMFRMPLQSMLPLEPFQKWGLDFIGPFMPITTITGNRYILTAMDYATKWMETWPLKVFLMATWTYLFMA